MYYTKLVYRDAAQHGAKVIEQDFPNNFKTAKAAEKFLEGRVAGMTCPGPAGLDLAIIGEVYEGNRLVTNIRLY